MWQLHDGSQEAKCNGPKRKGLCVRIDGNIPTLTEACDLTLMNVESGVY